MLTAEDVERIKKSNTISNKQTKTINKGLTAEDVERIRAEVNTETKSHAITATQAHNNFATKQQALTNNIETSNTNNIKTNNIELPFVSNPLYNSKASIIPQDPFIYSDKELYEDTKKTINDAYTQARFEYAPSNDMNVIEKRANEIVNEKGYKTLNPNLVYMQKYSEKEGKQNMNDILKMQVANMSVPEYEQYLANEATKEKYYEAELKKAREENDYDKVGQYQALYNNAKFGKEVQELTKKYDDWALIAQMNYGQLQIEYNDAVYNYLQDNSEDNSRRVEELKTMIGLYASRAENIDHNYGPFTSFAEYLPQLGGQVKLGLERAGEFGLAGVVAGSPAGLPGAGSLGIKGAKLGYMVGNAEFMYKQTIGSAYSELIDLGVPDEIAIKVAQDSAFWQSVVEFAETGVDMITLGTSAGIRKLTGKELAKVTESLTSKQVLRKALRAYLANLASETTEEAIQEKIQIEYILKATEEAGIDYKITKEEEAERIFEAAKGGFDVALFTGAGNFIGSITVSKISNSTIKTTDAFYDDAISKIQNSVLDDKTKAELIANYEKGKTDTRESIEQFLGNENVGNIKKAETLTQVKNATNQLIEEDVATDDIIAKAKENNQIIELEDYTTQDIKDIVSDHIQDIMPDVEIKDIQIIGSRARGDAKGTSDLDVVVEYNGDISEDGLFNVLNGEPLKIDGIQVDINPITASKSGTMAEFMKKSKEYDATKESDIFEPQSEYDANQDERINNKELYNAILDQLDPKEIATEEFKLLSEKYGDELSDMDWQDYADEVSEDATKIVYDRYVNSEEGKRFIEGYNVDISEPQSEYNTNNKKLSELIKDAQKEAEKNFTSKIDISKPSELNNYTSSMYKNLTEFTAKQLGTKIYRNHQNNNNKGIIVTSDDLTETFHKIFADHAQTPYIKYHLFAMSKLGNIIDEGKLIKTSDESKDRKKYLGWDYYVTYATIDNKPFLIEFDVAYKKDGKHFRLQRIKKIKIADVIPTTTSPKSDAKFVVSSANSNIPQNNNYVKQSNENTLQNVPMFNSEGIIKEPPATGLQSSKGIGSSSVSNKTNTSINNGIQQNNQNVNLDKTKTTTSKKIEDFGEKIGGARKDLYDGTHTTKTTTHNYTVTEKITKDENDNDKKVFFVRFKGKVLSTFDTQEEAEKFIQDYKDGLKNNRTKVKEVEVWDKDNNKVKKFEVKVVDPVSQKERSTEKYFDTKEEAKEFANLLNMYLTEHGKNLYRPPLISMTRVNPNETNSTTRSGKEILDTFKFRAGEFGNWVTNAERQKFLNYGYDALKDLATALEVEPSAVSYGNRMAIAFGARGKGLTGAVAHFEPNAVVINMTRLKGAGSLAHEMGHALDNYLSALSGYAEHDLLSNTRTPRNLSQEVWRAFDDLVDSIRTNTSTNQEEIDIKNSKFEKSRIDNLTYRLKYYDKVFDGNATRYKYSRKTKQYENIPIEVTAEQKKKYNEIKKVLMEGKLDSKREYNLEKTKLGGISNNVTYGKDLEDFRELVKEVTGRKIEDDDLYWIYRYGQPSRQVTGVKSASAFHKASIELDNLTGRAAMYYQKIEEEIARSFEAYIYDKLKEKGITNTYLVHSVNNSDYALFNPFPAGEEREKINAAWDKLINTMKKENLLIAKSKDVRADKITKNNSDVRYDRTIKSNVRKDRIETPSQENKTSNVETLKPTSREKDILLSQGISKEEINDPENTYIQGILSTLKSDKDYYDRALEEIEKDNNDITKRTNYLLNKRRWDVLNSGATDSKYAKKSSLSDIRQQIEKDISKPIRLKGFRNSAYGIYKISTDEIRVKDLSNIETITHELGHKIDFQMLKRVKDQNTKMEEELIELAERAFGDAYDDNILEKEEEGWAEFVRRFVVDNERTQKEYPALSDYFKGEISEVPKIKEAVTNMIELVENYVNAPSNVAIDSLLSVGEQTDKPQKDSFINNFMYQYFDDLWYLQKLTRAYANTQGKHITQLPTIENLYDKARLYKGNDVSIKNIIQHGFYDNNGTKVTKGLTEILEPFSDSPEKLAQVRELLFARRGLDYIAKNLEVGVLSPDILNTLETIKDPEIIHAVKQIEEFAEQPLKMAYESGMLKKEEYEDLKKFNRYYVPLKRVFDNQKVSSGVSRNGAKGLYKKRTGSLRNVVDPIESIAQNTAALTYRINHNNLMTMLEDYAKDGKMSDFYSIVDIPQQLKASVSADLFKTAFEDQLIDLGLENTENIDFNVIRNIFAPKLNDDKNMILTYMRDGTMKAIQFYDTHLYEFFANTQTIGKTAEDIFKVLDKATNLLRLGATSANLEFTATNILKDTVTAAFYSDSGFIPGVDTLKGLADYAIAKYGWLKDTSYAKENTRIYDYYQQSGAAMSTRLASYREGVQDYLKDAIGKYIVELNSDNKKTALEAAKNIWHSILDLENKGFKVLEALPELSEQGTRFGYFKKTYNKLINEGYSHEAAMLQAGIDTKDITLDFNRAGNTMRTINRLKAFANAQVQGVYRALLGTEKGIHNTKYGKALLLKLAILVGISMTLKSMSKDDKEIEEVSRTTKNDSWVFKLGDTIVKIPKPEDFIIRNAIDLANAIQDIIDGAKDVDKIRSEFLNNFINSLSFIDIDFNKGIAENIASNITPTATEPITEVALDRDFYYGSQITPYGTENGVSSKYQYDYKTSQTAIKLGQTKLAQLLKLSPAKIDHLFSGYGAGVAQQLLKITDNLIDAFSKDITLPKTAETDKLFVRRFTIDPDKNSQSVSDVYDLYDELNTKKADSKFSGIGLSETESNMLDNLTRAKDTFTDINKEIKNATTSLTMSAEEKRNRIDELKSLRTDVARYYLGKELINENNLDTIKLYEFYPDSDEYKVGLSQVTLTDDDKQYYAKTAQANYDERMKAVSSEYKKASEQEKKDIEDYQKDKANDFALNKLKEKLAKNIK